MPAVSAIGDFIICVWLCCMVVGFVALETLYIIDAIRKFRDAKTS